MRAATEILKQIRVPRDSPRDPPGLFSPLVPAPPTLYLQRGLGELPRPLAFDWAGRWNAPVRNE